MIHNDSLHLIDDLFPEEVRETMRTRHKERPMQKFFPNNKKLDIEEQDGITVILSRPCNPGLPSGELLGVLPWFQWIKENGFTHVIHYDKATADSHAIYAYATGVVGLKCVCYTSANAENKQLKLAQSFDADIFYMGPMKEDKLKFAAINCSAAMRNTKNKNPYLICKWHRNDSYYEGIKKAFDDIDGGKYDAHVVPMHNGSFVYGISTAIHAVPSRSQIAAVTATDKVKQMSDRIEEFGRPGTQIYPIGIKHPITNDLPIFFRSSKLTAAAWQAAKDLIRKDYKVCLWNLGLTL